MLPLNFLRFSINLTCDEGEDSDIALHFNPRFGDRQVVCNTREGGDWQEEVVTEKEEFPFEKKDAFEIAISVKEDKFVVCSHVFLILYYLFLSFSFF